MRLAVTFLSIFLVISCTLHSFHFLCLLLFIHFCGSRCFPFHCVNFNALRNLKRHCRRCRCRREHKSKAARHSLFKLCLSPAFNRASFVIEINVAHTPWHALRQLLQYIYNINSNHICKHCYEFIISLNYVQQQ